MKLESLQVTIFLFNIVIVEILMERILSATLFNCQSIGVQYRALLQGFSFTIFFFFQCLLLFLSQLNLRMI